MWADTLDRVLAGEGLQVRTYDGWTRHGHGQLSAVRGIVWHHTATPPSAGTAGPVSVVRNGRTDLPGPLAQLCLDRDGVWHVVAAGLAYHAGSGSWPGLAGNSDCLGVECLHTGTAAERWSPVQLESLRVGTAALCSAYDLDPARVLIGHREWTSRKVDPYGLDLDDERATVAQLMEGGQDVPLTDEDLKRIRDTVRREVRAELREREHYGRTLAEWMRRAANLAEQASGHAERGTAAAVWNRLLPPGHQAPVPAWKWLRNRFGEVRGQLQQLGADPPDWDRPDQERPNS